MLVVLTIVLAAAQPAAAQEAGTEVEITGTVTSIDEATGTFTVETEDGETCTISPGEDFDFSTLVVGDTVEVEGTLNEDGTVSALRVDAEEPEDEQDDPCTGYFCTQTENLHPFG